MDYVVRIYFNLTGLLLLRTWKEALWEEKIRISVLCPENLMVNHFIMYDFIKLKWHFSFLFYDDTETEAVVFQIIYQHDCEKNGRI